MQSASAYLFGGKVVLSPDDQTTTGLWITGEPVGAYDPADPRALGEGVLQALARSRRGTPHPTDWKGRFDPVLRAAQAKSRKAFMASARLVLITAEGGETVLEPTENRGGKEGFEGLSAARRTVGTRDPLRLGEELLMAFSDAR
jgi:hypothetical protein